MAMLFLVSGSAAFAQTPASSLAASAPRPAAHAREVAIGTMARWLCAGGLEMEVRPLSYDGAVVSAEWVVVYKRGGVAYSAERIDKKTAQGFQADDCRKAKLVG
jgi:hypothetical protein